jgi:drug/metabolite transporter (DMT)-like permease
MDRSKYIGHFSILLANIFFGLNNPLSRSLMPEIIDPYVLTFFRIVGGGFLFWTFSFFVRYEKVSSKDLFLLFIAAFFGLTANQLPFIVGLSMTSPIDASIVVTLLPIISMILAFLIIREPITFKKVFGVILGAFGALFLVFNNRPVVSGDASNMMGNMIIFIAVISFSLYLTLFKSLISRYRPTTLMKWMFLFSTIQCLPFCVEPLSVVDFSAYDFSVWLRIFYVVVIASFIAYFLLAIGQKALRPTTLSMYNYLQPIVSSLAAVAMGIDSFGLDKLFSAILVFSGVYFVTQSKSRAQIEQEVKRNIKHQSNNS